MYQHIIADARHRRDTARPIIGSRSNLNLEILSLAAISLLFCRVEAIDGSGQ